ncbi:hypothetical protein D3C72_2488240 [compost metagenome]
MDVLSEAILEELQGGHRNDMVLDSMMDIQCRDIGVKCVSMWRLERDKVLMTT